MSTNRNFDRYKGLIRAALIASIGLFADTAIAASYHITVGMGYTVCEAFKHHLDERTAANPMVCQIELDPHYDRFSRPDWHELSLDKPENLALFRKLDQIVRENVNSIVNDGEPVQKLSKEEWLKDFRYHKRGPGEPHLYKGKLGLDGEGKDETVIAITWGSKACERFVAGKQGDLGLVVGTGPYSLFIYNPVKNRVNLKITYGEPIGIGNYDVLMFQRRAFFLKTYYLPPKYNDGFSHVQIRTYGVWAGRGGLITRCAYEMDLSLRHSTFR